MARMIRDGLEFRIDKPLMNLRCEFTCDSDYGHVVEYGDLKNEPRPFMLDAMLNNGSDFLDGVRDGILVGLEE